jgi:hypothetical protein
MDLKHPIVESEEEAQPSALPEAFMSKRVIL